ncbi:transposable element Tcb1 transposase [Trichonephila clavipes]|nr:transposable element Tcb1 transposase [Trichonephila clavipes]
MDRSHSPGCTTARDDKRMGRMAGMDRAVTSRTIAQQIQSVTHLSVSAHAMRCPLQQSGMSASRPLFRLPLTGNHRRLGCQWCDERRTWTNTCLQHHEGRIRVRHRGERLLNCCVMHHPTGSALGIMVWGGIGFRYRLPLVRIADTLNSQRCISEVLELAILSYI